MASKSVDYSKYTFYAVLLLAAVVLVSLIFANKKYTFITLPNDTQGASIVGQKNALSTEQGVVSTFCFMNPENPKCKEDNTWSPVVVDTNTYSATRVQNPVIISNIGKIRCRWKGGTWESGDPGGFGWNYWYCNLSKVMNPATNPTSF